MAASDLTSFIQDVLTRFDPTLDLSDGSRADTEIVQPIVQRVGLDPFDNDILTFVQQRVQQSFPDLAITEADPLTDTVIDPMRVLIEPIVREVKLIRLRSYLRNITTLSDDEVDALMGNFFEARVSGGFSIGVVRIFFATPQSISLTLTNPATTSDGLRFFPSRPQAITADEMLLNVDGSQYYFDVNYTAEQRGDNYNVDPNTIKSIANLPTATSVRNPARFAGGSPREASTDFAARVQAGQGDKTLNTNRGIVAVLTDNFPTIERIFDVGFRDPEMLRDVVKGGSLGPIPDDDVFGHFYGDGTAADDLNGDLITNVVDAPTGNFITRVGASGTVPTDWYLTLVYRFGLASVLAVVDAKITKVLSGTQVLVDVDLPVTAPATALVWMLRKKKITISDIPGGIVLPNAANGQLDIADDTVHIGGKTDVYLAGPIDSATSQITSLTDEDPSAKGVDAQTQGSVGGSEDIILINDLVPGTIEAGMSMVLEEGTDAGSYRILEVIFLSNLGPPPHGQIRIDTKMTGTQGGLAWKVVDEIDVELTDPRDVKLEGSDLITTAGNPAVTTGSGTNFIDANVQPNDILEIFDPDFGGEFTVQTVGPVDITVSPAPGRTFGAAAYRIFRRSERVETPVVRISALELLDSTGAPSGTKVPYRDPVLAVSNAFQNEGSGFAFDGIAIVGLVSKPFTTLPLGGTTIDWSAYVKDTIWAGILNAATFLFSGSLGSPKTPQDAADDINADVVLSLVGIKGVVLTKDGQQYLGLVSLLQVRADGGTAISLLGWDPGMSNSMIRSTDAHDTFTLAETREGDVIEVIEGTNTGTTGRVIRGPFADVLAPPIDHLLIGSGPLGPPDLNGLPGLYNNVVFSPDVNVRVRVGRPSIGSARVYFLAPTSAEFDYRTTRFTDDTPQATLVFRPDPENVRIIRPPPPSTVLPNTGTTMPGSPDSLLDTNANFLLFNIQPGDLLDILYVPIVGTSALSPSGNIAVGGLYLRLRLDTDTFITISFPFDMPRQNVVDFINQTVGEDVASLDGGGNLVLSSSHRIELDPSSTILTDVSDPLFLAGAALNSDHPDRGTRIITAVSGTVLQLSTATAPLTGGSVTNTSYRIRRFVQRISSTEMNANLEASGLYFADVQMESVAPGDIYNIAAGVELAITGHRSDGYRLRTGNDVTSYSRAETIFAQISRSILLVGSSDDPAQATQLSQQNVQVSYDRSQLVDDVQSFCDSDFQRVVVEEILVRHLLPHYVSFTWSYAAGATEPDMLAAIDDMLNGVEPDTQLEVTDLTDVLRRRQATSVFTPDAASSTGRSAPFFIVVFHNIDRTIHAQIVKDFVVSVRMQRFIPDNIVVKRLTASGIR